MTNREKQAFAYYMAKHNMNGLQLTEADILEAAGISKSNFRRKVAQWRYLLNMEGNQKDDPTKNQKHLYDEFENMTVTQMRTLLIESL